MHGISVASREFIKAMRLFLLLFLAVTFLIITCNFQSLGFAMTFSALFSKIWRLNRIYHNASNFRRVKVRKIDVMLPFVVLMSANFAVLLAWTLVDPRVWHRTEPDVNYNSEGYCVSFINISISDSLQGSTLVSPRNLTGNTNTYFWHLLV
jgi:hypothetical protein